MQPTRENRGKQIGDSGCAARTMIHTTKVETAPRHPVLGAFGVKAVTDKLKERLDQIEPWRNVGLAADLPA